MEVEVNYDSNLVWGGDLKMHFQFLKSNFCYNFVPN